MISPATLRRVSNSDCFVGFLCVLALLLRLAPALENRFHPDEALYGTWAMHVASGRDVLLAQQPVDKPPLAIYAMALSLAVFGRSELAARLPSLAASVFSVVLVRRWVLALAAGRASSSRARSQSELRAGGDARGEGQIAALLMSLSPFNIAFGGTAFLDPFMVMWGLAACVEAGRGRWGRAGLLLGMAFATKVQGLFFAPLIVLTAAYAGRTEIGPKYPVFTARSAARFAPGLIFIVALIAAWSLARGGTPFWVQQTINYGGIRLAHASELPGRLMGWLNWLPDFFGPVAGAALAAGLLLNALERGRQLREYALDLMLVAYVLCYIGFHWLLAFPVWDRYLLILPPVTAVLMERALAGLQSRSVDSRSQIGIERIDRWIMPAIAAAMIAPYATAAVRSELAIGGDPSTRDGIDRVATYLREMPIGTVVYDHSYGWELGFYLWNSSVYIAYFDAPDDLAGDLRVFGARSTRYIVIPADESPDTIMRAISAEGFALKPVLMTTDRFDRVSFNLYRITDGSISR